MRQRALAQFLRQRKCAEDGLRRLENRSSAPDDVGRAAAASWAARSAPRCWPQSPICLSPSRAEPCDAPARFRPAPPRASEEGSRRWCEGPPSPRAARELGRHLGGCAPARVEFEVARSHDPRRVRCPRPPRAAPAVTGDVPTHRVGIIGLASGDHSGRTTGAQKRGVRGGRAGDEMAPATPATGGATPTASVGPRVAVAGKLTRQT